MRPQPAVRVDRARVADQRQHWEVVVGVRVREAVGKIKSVLMCQRAYRLRFGRAMEQTALQPPGIDAVMCSAVVPKAPVSPSRAAMMPATSTGAAVTSQTCCPTSRCI